MFGLFLSCDVVGFCFCARGDTHLSEIVVVVVLVVVVVVAAVVVVVKDSFEKLWGLAKIQASPET